MTLDTEAHVAALRSVNDDADILTGLETEALRCMFSRDQPGADRIRKAHARLTTLHAVNDDFAKLAGEQRLRIAELEAALKPFAAMVSVMNASVKDDASFHVETSMGPFNGAITSTATHVVFFEPFTMGDLRRALAALSPAKPGAAGT